MRIVQNNLLQVALDFICNKDLNKILGRKEVDPKPNNIIILSHIANLINSLIQKAQYSGAEEVFKSKYYSRLIDMQLDTEFASNVYSIIGQAILHSNNKSVISTFVHEEHIKNNFQRVMNNPLPFTITKFMELIQIILNSISDQELIKEFTVYQLDEVKFVEFCILYLENSKNDIKAKQSILNTLELLFRISIYNSEESSKNKYAIEFFKLGGNDAVEELISNSRSQNICTTIERIYKLFCNYDDDDEDMLCSNSDSDD